MRIRVCGLCWADDRLLLINHEGLYGHPFWSPPGGGIDFGTSAEVQLIREFHEETGLDVTVGEFLFASEYIHAPLHAVELFFEVQVQSGQLKKGIDPEYPQNKQVITDIRYFSEDELGRIPEGHCHGLFRLAKTRSKIRAIRGYHKI